MMLRVLCSLVVIFAFGYGSVYAADNGLFVGSFKQLLFDDKILDSTFGVEWIVNPPELLGAVMEQEFAWESCPVGQEACPPDALMSGPRGSQPTE